jgi:hypothetical protein
VSRKSQNVGHPKQAARRYGATSASRSRAHVKRRARCARRKRQRAKLPSPNCGPHLGLTHGGFYRHFESKEDLFVDAITRGFQEAADSMVAAAAKAPHGKRLRAIIEHYLSVEHLEDPGGGCALSTLAPEIARQRPAVRARINAAMKSYRERLLPFSPVHRTCSGDGRGSDDRSRHD